MAYYYSTYDSSTCNSTTSVTYTDAGNDVIYYWDVATDSGTTYSLTDTADYYRTYVYGSPQVVYEEDDHYEGVAVEEPVTQERDREAAENRAKDLLKEILGQEDYERFRFQKYIDIPSKARPGLGYRIKARMGSEIRVLEARSDGGWREQDRTLCIHAENYHKYVEDDFVIQQLIICLFDEDLLWKTANEHLRPAA